jgi:hypothetical protein
MKRKSYVLPLLLASCGTLPEPFYGDPGKVGAQLAAPAAPVLVIPTPAGAMLGSHAAALYANDLANALNAIDVPSIARPATRSDWTLETTADQSGGNITPNYAIIGPGGKSYGMRSGAPVNAAAWANGDPTALNAAATADALTLSQTLAAVNAQVQQSNPESLENRPPRVFMGAVTGAPGDGDNALAINMTRDLPSTQTEMVTTPASADFTITGVVKTQPDSNHQLLVELDWIVTDSSKRQIGQVTQLHDLSPADVEPVWGDVAAAAASEAAAGVNQVIANATLKKASANMAIASGPLAGGMALAIPPIFALPAPGTASTEMAAFQPPVAAPVEMASISEPLPVRAADLAAAPAPATAVPERLAAQRHQATPALAAPARAPAVTAPIMLASVSPRTAPAGFLPFSAARAAADAAGSLFGKIAGLFAPVASTAGLPAVADAVAPTEAPAIAPAQSTFAPAEATVQPTEADVQQAAFIIQPTVLITPVQATPLPRPGGSELAAEYGATALITPVTAVALPPPAVPAARRVTRVAVMRGRFNRPVPVSAPVVPMAPIPVVATPTLPALVSISDSQLWRVAVPIPVTFGTPDTMFRRLVYEIPAATTEPLVRHEASRRLHLHLAAFRPAVGPAPQGMTIPAQHPHFFPAVTVAALAPPPAPAAAPPPPRPAVSGPIESSYDVLER